MNDSFSNILSGVIIIIGVIGLIIEVMMTHAAKGTPIAIIFIAVACCVFLVATGIVFIITGLRQH